MHFDIDYTISYCFYTSCVINQIICISANKVTKFSLINHLINLVSLDFYTSSILVTYQ